MKKSVFPLLFLLLLYNAFVYSEEVVAKNTISVGESIVWIGSPVGFLPGLNIEYERLLSNNFALAVDVGVDALILLYADTYARWYPWAGKFFTNLGFGIWRYNFNTWNFTPVISPGIGWKIDIGEPNGWNLITGIIGRVFFYEDDRNNFTVDITTKIIFRVGYSF